MNSLCSRDKEQLLIETISCECKQSLYLNIYPNWKNQDYKYVEIPCCCSLCCYFGSLKHENKIMRKGL